MKRVISGMVLGLTCIAVFMYLLVAGFPAFTPPWLSPSQPIPLVWVLWATLFVGSMVLIASGFTAHSPKRESK